MRKTDFWRQRRKSVSSILPHKYTAKEVKAPKGREISVLFNGRYLLGLDVQEPTTHQMFDVIGLTPHQIKHIQFIVDDLQQN